MREIKWRVMNAFTKQWQYYTALEVEGSDYTGGLGWAFNTMGEFTGKTDKNEVEIYEGDVVKAEFEECPCIVQWQTDGSVGWSLKPIRGDWAWTQTSFLSKVWHEVIGNIHDNPELLEK